MLPREDTIEALRHDPEIADAISDHVEATGASVVATRAQVETYLAEIVPAFSLVSFSAVAYRLARLISRILYRTTVVMRDEGAIAQSSRGDVIVYLSNHRSNADYVLLTAVLGRAVCISYAVGEWARTWPLEPLFRRFGAYFVRRGFREPLYHRVLASYVRYITRHAVVQGIFPEGGLTKTGRLLPPRLGLLDAIVTTLTDPRFEGDVRLVPVALNYDRVLEDRVLLSEQLTGRRPDRFAQLLGVVSFVGYNMIRVLSGQYRRYGQAAAVFGPPISVRDWLARHPEVDLKASREIRRPGIEGIATTAMNAIAVLVPVTPITLVALVLVQCQDEGMLLVDVHAQLVTIRNRLQRQGVVLVRDDLTVEEVWDRAFRTLRARHLVRRVGGEIRIVRGAQPLLAYYAASVAHHLTHKPAP